MVVAHVERPVKMLVIGQVEREWVGLRPGRDSVRLEAESVALPADGGRPAETLSVIHCYGAPQLPQLFG